MVPPPSSSPEGEGGEVVEERPVGPSLSARSRRSRSALARRCGRPAKACAKETGAYLLDV